jgi:Fe-S-cluster containining protein
MLTKNETELFPAEAIAPQYAVGTVNQKKIILYQMKVGPCPKLSPENKCQIYEKRPLICRSFPIMADYISSKCKAFSYRKPGQIYQDIYPMTEMKEANAKISRFVEAKIKKASKTGMREWEYDLASKKWILRK